MAAELIGSEKGILRCFTLQQFMDSAQSRLLPDFPFSQKHTSHFGKIVIHAQDLRILKSLGFEDPQILKMYLGINGLFPD